MTPSNPPNAIIRKAETDNLESVTQLCAAHAAFERADFDPADHGERLSLAIGGSKPRLVIFLAEVDGNAAGFAAITRDFSTWRAREFLHMDCLFVTEHLRGRGVGGQLFRAVLDEAKACGIGEVQWQTPAWNEEAVHFYRTQRADGQPKIRFAIDV